MNRNANDNYRDSTLHLSQPTPEDVEASKISTEKSESFRYRRNHDQRCEMFHSENDMNVNSWDRYPVFAIVLTMYDIRIDSNAMYQSNV